MSTHSTEPSPHGANAAAQAPQRYRLATTDETSGPACARAGDPARSCWSSSSSGALLNVSFLSYDNIFGILQQASELAVLVMGLTLVLITGKFDLSLESTFGLAPMVGAYLLLSPATDGLGPARLADRWRPGRSSSSAA